MTALRQALPKASLGLWAPWLAAFFAAAALTALATFDVYPPGDVAIARVVQSVRLPGLGQISEGLYRVGAAPLFQIIALAVAAALIWRGQRLTAGFVVLAVVGRGIGAVIKELVERPRPSPFLVDVSEQANGFSFPSGHVLGTVLVWGFVCYAALELIPDARWRRLVQGACLAVIALMGLQRVYTGAHWPSDVLAAYLWGGVILFALAKGHSWLTGRWRPTASAAGVA